MADYTAKTIRIRIDVESDLFSAMDPDQKIISEDVITYVMRAFQNVHENRKEEYTVEIISDHQLDEAGIEEKIRDCFVRERTVIRRNVRKMTIKAVCLALFGSAVLSACYALADVISGLNYEVLDIIGWVTIWEASSIIIIGGHEARESKRDFEMLSKAKIVCKVND